MAFCCSECSFTAQFESALMMHRQLHHAATTDQDMPNKLKDNLEQPLCVSQSPRSSPYHKKKNRDLKLASRTSSATRLLGKIRARICKSKTLCSHPEEVITESAVNVNSTQKAGNITSLNGETKELLFQRQPSPSECTSKAMKDKVDILSLTSTCLDDKETYGCHLCPFEADRITVLDRHLLNHHKIGLETLLKLVLAKTKDGLNEDTTFFGHHRQPYYKAQDEMIEENGFIIETVAPKIKILKHASTNTESYKDMCLEKADSTLEKNCSIINKEIENMLNGELKYENGEFLTKMKTLNDCMFKFVDSSNALKRVLSKELDSKIAARELDDELFHLNLDRATPRNWEIAHSEKIERSRSKYAESSRGDKPKPFPDKYF